MSAQVKKAGRIGTKIVAVFLFLFLLMFNVELSLYNGEATESGMLGLTLGLFLKDAIACDNPGASCAILSNCDSSMSCCESGEINGCTIRCVSAPDNPINCPNSDLGEN